MDAGPRRLRAALAGGRDRKGTPGPPRSRSGEPRGVRRPRDPGPVRLGPACGWDTSLTWFANGGSLAGPLHLEIRDSAFLDNRPLEYTLAHSPAAGATLWIADTVFARNGHDDDPFAPTISAHDRMRLDHVDFGVGPDANGVDLVGCLPLGPGVRGQRTLSTPMPWCP